MFLRNSWVDAMGGSLARPPSFSQPPGSRKGPYLALFGGCAVLPAVMIDEFDEEVRELKREIIETRGLIIKTNNLTNALSADLKSIAKRQHGYERRLIWNSATAYVVFVVVVFIALKLAWDARVDAVRAETEQTRQSVDRLSRELKEAQKRDEERSKAEARAATFYDLIRQGKKTEVVDQFEALGKERLTK